MVLFFEQVLISIFWVITLDNQVYCRFSFYLRTKTNICQDMVLWSKENVDITFIPMNNLRNIIQFRNIPVTIGTVSIKTLISGLFKFENVSWTRHELLTLPCRVLASCWYLVYLLVLSTLIALMLLNYLEHIRRF